MSAPSRSAERETPAGLEAMREAVAYLTPHPSTKGPVILDPVKMRSALAIIASELARLTERAEIAEAERDRSVEAGQFFEREQRMWFERATAAEAEALAHPTNLRAMAKLRTQAEIERDAAVKRAKAANRRADKADKERKYFKLVRRAEHEARVAAEADTTRLRADLARKEEALRLAIQLADRVGGEDITFEDDGPMRPRIDAGERCNEIAEALGIECGGPEWFEMLKPSNPEQIDA